MNGLNTFAYGACFYIGWRLLLLTISLRNRTATPAPALGNEDNQQAESIIYSAHDSGASGSQH